MTDFRDTIVDVLTESEVKRLETLVQQEEEKKQKEDLRKKYKEYYARKLRQQIGVDEPIEEITVDLAKHSNAIVIDGVSYLHGQTYKVRASLADELRHIMQSTYEHQAEIDGKPKRYYRDTTRDMRISPHGAVNSSQLLRV